MRIYKDITNGSTCIEGVISAPVYSLACTRNGDLFTVTETSSGFCHLYGAHYTSLQDASGNTFQTAEDAEAYIQGVVDPSSLLQRPDTLRIYKHIPDHHRYTVTDPPFSVNYITGLTKKPSKVAVYNKGECTQVDYLVDGEVIVREHRTFVWDQAGVLVTECTAEAEYFRNDGVPSSLTKDISEQYSSEAGRFHSKKRRSNNILSIETKLLQIAEVGGQSSIEAASDLWVSLKNEIEDYINTGSNGLASAVAVHTDAMFDVVLAPGVTIRDYVLGELS